MSRTLAILCYHRVLPDEARHKEGWPYFARGTAVSCSTLARHLASLAAHTSPVDEATALAWLDGATHLPPRAVWLTFDDGYLDVLDHALPLLAACSVPATVFVTTCTLSSPPRVLPADRWYATLLDARQPRGFLSLGNEEGCWAFDLTHPQDRQRLVDGPERRRFLRADPSTQEACLDALRRALDAPGDATPGSLYLTPAGLHTLRSRGWSIGAHGATHALFPTLPLTAQEAELDAIQATFAALGLPQPRSFAYPDGAFDDRSASLLIEHGYRAALSLGQRPAIADQPFDLARFLVPDDPSWVEQQLVPLLTEART